jgi:hypothetical protein
MSDIESKIKQLVLTYVGEIPLDLPTSGYAAEDWDRKRHWYSQARAQIRAHPELAIPHLRHYAHQPGVKDLLKAMGVDEGDMIAPLPDDATLAQLIDDASQPQSRDQLAQMGAAVIPALMKQLAQSPQGNAYTISQVIKKIARNAALFDALLPYTRDEYTPGVRGVAVHFIGYTDHPLRYDVLINALKDPAPEVHQPAITAWGDLNAEKDYILPFLDHTDKRTVHVTKLALFAMDDPRGYGAAYALAESEWSNSRLKAVPMLAKIISESTARDHLTQLAQDEAAEVRASAQRTIKRLHDHSDRKIAKWARNTMPT